MAVPASAVSIARAWLLEVAPGKRLAAGAPFVVEYLLETETITLPCMPSHVPGVMLWREHMIPVVDLIRVLPGSGAATGDWSRAVVLAWQEAPGKPLRHGALRVCAPPNEVFAADDMFCPLPEGQPLLRHLARSCFAHNSDAIPVLDVARLFGEALPPELLPAEALVPAVALDAGADPAPVEFTIDTSGLNAEPEAEAPLAPPPPAHTESAGRESAAAEALGATVPAVSDEQALAGYVDAATDPAAFEFAINTTGLNAEPEAEAPLHTQTEIAVPAPVAVQRQAQESPFTSSLARYREREHKHNPHLGRDRFQKALLGAALVGLSLLIVVAVLFLHIRDTNSRQQDISAVGPGSTGVISVPAAPAQPPR